MINNINNSNIESYAHARALLNPCASRKLKANLVLRLIGKRIELVHYAQVIFVWHSNGVNEIIKPSFLNNNNLSATTKRHLNNYMPPGMRVFTNHYTDMVSLDAPGGELTLQLFA